MRKNWRMNFCLRMGSSFDLDARNMAKLIHVVVEFGSNTAQIPPRTEAAEELTLFVRSGDSDWSPSSCWLPKYFGLSPNARTHFLEVPVPALSWSPLRIRWLYTTIFSAVDGTFKQNNEKETPLYILLYNLSLISYVANYTFFVLTLRVKFALSKSKYLFGVGAKCFPNIPYVFLVAFILNISLH